MDWSKKIQKDLAEAMMEDPNIIIVEMDFPIADTLTKYLESINRLEQK